MQEERDAERGRAGLLEQQLEKSARRIEALESLLSAAEGEAADQADKLEDTQHAQKRCA